MKQAKSVFLSTTELKALKKIGDIIIPENNPFPSFSQTACIQHIDDVLSFLCDKDLADLKALLRFNAFLPTSIVSLALRLMNSSLLSIFRLVSLGLKGLIMTLYYSNKTGIDYKGKQPYDIIDYHVHVIPKNT